MTEQRGPDRRTEEMLRLVVEGTATATGWDFFPALVRNLTRALDLRYCFVSQCLSVPPTRVGVLAFWTGDRFLESFEYDLAGTPCEKVVSGETCVYREGVRELFPADRDLVDLEAESYAAVAMHDAAGRIIGHLAVLDTRPLPDASPDLDLLKIFAARAGAELERQRVLDSLERSRSRLKQVVAQRERAEERLREANEELRNVLSIVSHDLRAPLVNLRGFSAELRRQVGLIAGCLHGAAPAEGEHRDRLEETLEKGLPESLRYIESSVDRLDFFMEALLKLAQASQRPLEEEPVEVAAVVEKILGSLHFQIERHPATVEVGELPEVVADPLALEQILGNLLTNAVAYLEPGRPGRIEIEAEREAGAVTLRVRDNGRGIAADDLPRVFAPFRRCAPQVGAGEGMGLAYAQALVRRLGGRLSCESEPGRGSTFSLTVPAPGNPA